MQSEEISTTNHQELLNLVDVIELENAERMQYIVELSKLSNGQKISPSFRNNYLLPRFTGQALRS